MLGENPELENLPIVEWYLFFFFSLIINTVALNMLISIIGETFGNVMQDMDGYHVQTKAEILY